MLGKRLFAPFKSPALLVAIVALVVAIGGTAAATPGAHVAKKKHHKAPKLTLNSTDQKFISSAIKKGSVLFATSAGSSATAGSATTAANATTATTATNATTASGVTGLYRWRTTVATPGASSSTPNVVTLATIGPFTIVGECYTSGSDADAGTFVSTSEDGVFVQGYSGHDYEPLTVAQGAVRVSDDIADADPATLPSSEEFEGPDDGSFAGETPDGSLAFDGFENQGAYIQGASGPACSFSGFAFTE